MFGCLQGIFQVVVGASLGHHACGRFFGGQQEPLPAGVLRRTGKIFAFSKHVLMCPLMPAVPGMEYGREKWGIAIICEIG
ncbi:MAG: hypothetical protein CSA33_01785 [Desulfobulbus propionicus]|nr:MAG: hypothetical protein CSA33_01785 [Desulfobulbus propionicus]